MSELKRQPETLFRERLNMLNQFFGDKGEVNSSSRRDVKRSLHYDREFERHVYTANGKRQTSDSSWEFLRIENEQIKTAQNNSYG